MSYSILIPAPGESINEVTIGRWMKKDGEKVNKDEEILEIESEKASLSVTAEKSGILKILAQEGETVATGSVAGEITESAEESKTTEPEGKPKEKSATNSPEKIVEILAPQPGESITEVTLSTWNAENGASVKKDEEIGEVESEKASLPIISEADGVLEIVVPVGETIAPGTILAKVHAGAEVGKSDSEASQNSENSSSNSEKIASPAAAKILREKGISADRVSGSGKDGRIIKEDALRSQKTANEQIAASAEKNTESSDASKDSRGIRREKMTNLRKKISERLVSVKNHTAMLTTFNEVDMSKVMQTRKEYKEIFKEKHNVGLGFMSFFSKACAIALEEFPLVNAQIDGTEIVRFDYVDLGIAVSAPKGLMVPVVRNASDLSLAEIENTILTLAKKARDGKLGIDEMTGGTFTITNGGVFGSMLSTPILNPPQSAILGMHNIVERPVAINGEVKIRPIMYLALSYDHRIIDGKDSVSFLVRVKQLIEDPVRMLLQA